VVLLSGFAEMEVQRGTLDVYLAT